MRKISKRKSLKLNTNVGAFDDSILLVAIERN